MYGKIKLSEMYISRVSEKDKLQLTGSLKADKF